MRLRGGHPRDARVSGGERTCDRAVPEGAADRNEVRVTTSLDPTGFVAVSVSDTGCGIPPEHVGRVFDPFFTTKPVGVGTGLGLYVCHRIITALGGTIAVRSQVGKGTTIRVLLRPAAQ